MATSNSVSFNPSVKLILADVDQTIADDFLPATPDMIRQLTRLLEEGRVLFLVTGGPVGRVDQRIISAIPAKFRDAIVVSHCSGAEAWGYSGGKRRPDPIYSLYDSSLTPRQKEVWRQCVERVMSEFKLVGHPPIPVAAFRDKYGLDPLQVIFEDRGPQITIEFINGYDLTPEQEAALEISVPNTRGALDLRVPVLERIDELLQASDIPVTPRLAGVFALDLALKGVSKTQSITRLLGDDAVLSALHLTRSELDDPTNIEIWGDRFDRYAGTDRHIQEAVSPKVRAIDFRAEDPDNFLPGYNTVLWPGERHLQDGLLEYLESRPTN